MFIRKTKDITSIKSQLHQPPQNSSWLAQTIPKNIDNPYKKVNKNIKPFTKLKFFLKKFFLKFFLKKKIKKLLEAYNNNGCINIKPPKRFALIFVFSSKHSKIV